MRDQLTYAMAGGELPPELRLSKAALKAIFHSAMAKIRSPPS